MKKNNGSCTVGLMLRNNNYCLGLPAVFALTTMHPMVVMANATIKKMTLNIMTSM